jgi:hypothetical protein
MEGAMTDHHALLLAILRSDFVTFVEKCFETLEPGATYEDNWHVHAIAHQLVRVWRGESTRLIINIPPRMMKSIMVTIAFSAWVMGHDPRKRIMAVSYAKSLAGKHASDFRAIVESPWFRAAFPDFKIETNRAWRSPRQPEATASPNRSAARS